jgi:hypothetical protein
MTSLTATRTIVDTDNCRDDPSPALPEIDFGRDGQLVSLRELQAALLTGPPAQRLTAPAKVPVRSRARGGARPGGAPVTGGDSRTGGRLSPPPPTSAPGASELALVATHGGAGARSLATVLEAATVHRSWPAETELNLPVPVLLVCRSHAYGLSSAQRFAREYRDGESMNVRLLGCVVVADAPGRLPIGLRRLQRLLAAAVPRLWTVPWVPAWRLAAPDPAQPPEWAAALRAELDQAAGR